MPPASNRCRARSATRSTIWKRVTPRAAGLATRYSAPICNSSAPNCRRSRVSCRRRSASATPRFIKTEMPENAARLLSADDPPPVRVLRPEGRSDFVLTADHAGRAIPKRLGTLGLPDSELARHIAWDIGVAGVTERLSEALDAAAVLQTYSRLVIDCNRQPGLATSIPT